MTTNNVTIGIDLGDRKHSACVLSAAGEIRAEEATAATPLISPESAIMFTFHMALYFKRDGSPARRAWLI